MKKLLITVLLIVISSLMASIDLDSASLDCAEIDTDVQRDTATEIYNTFEETEDEQQTDETIVVIEGHIVEEELVIEEESIIEDKDKIEYTSYDVPENSGFKSYMDYRAVTNKESQQYKLLNLYTNTGDYGIRMVDDRYCIAVGTHFTTEIGQYLDLILENGTVIPCVLADVKADIHTDSNNIVTLHNGCVSEFVVDISSLYNTAKVAGDISYCCDEWDSPVTEIVVYEKNVFNQ